ncbi:CDC26 [Auxenochlorella protothecoides x Auxenochlorella symbiontica]
MLQREPTRIELRAEDKEEYLAVRREQQEARLSALAEQTGKQPLTPLFVGRKPSTAARLGLAK